LSGQTTIVIPRTDTRASTPAINGFFAGTLMEKADPAPSVPIAQTAATVLENNFRKVGQPRCGGPAPFRRGTATLQKETAANFGSPERQGRVRCRSGRRRLLPPFT
jgi:hypothetical protein